MIQCYAFIFESRVLHLFSCDLLCIDELMHCQSPLKNDEVSKKNEEKLANLRKRIEDAGIPTSVLDDGHISYALRCRYSSGDEQKAFEYLIFMKDAIAGVVQPYDPNVHMLGAVNRGNVTCWLDATLFAMFSNLTSFEPMLHANFDDSNKSRLVTLIRLWVNLLRAGKLIDIDLVSERSIVANFAFANPARRKRYRIP